MSGDPARSGAAALAPDFLRMHQALAELALASGAAAPLAQHTTGRHLAFLPPEALELDLSVESQREFGDYELLQKIGQGGMGVVYRARQKSLDREVAVKLLAAGPWASRDFIERFRREAQSAARMQHPGIVSIFEVGAQDELNYFSMELVRGESLAGLLTRTGPLPPRRAAALLRTIAEAVDYAHRLGVLHLDLKPGNVLIDERGDPLVADFGLARRLDETLASDSDEVSGTPSYMAPEQAVLKSHKLSPATDVYGLGAILYESLSGRPPFLGATPQQTLQRVVKDEPEPLQRIAATVPADLAAITDHCLAKEPQRRYSSARALADDLNRYLDGRPVSVRPLGTVERFARAARREPRAAVALGAFVLALLVGLVTTALQWRRADANAVDSRENLWVARAHAAQAALAEGDGFRGLRPLVANLAEMEAARRGADAAVERQRIGTVLANAPQLVDLTRLPQGEAVWSLAIAPDGRHFAMAISDGQDRRSVRQFEVASGRALWSTTTNGLTNGEPDAQYEPHGAMWYTADGSRIIVQLYQQYGFAVPVASDALALDASDGRVLAPPGPMGDRSDLIYSDDGGLALVRYRSDPSRRLPDFGQFHATADWRALGPRFALDDALGGDEWLPMPDGSAMLGTGACCRFTLFEPTTLAPRWRLDLPADDPVRAWRFNADGAFLALGTMRGAVYLVDTRDGSRTELPTARVATVRWLEFGADSATLVAMTEDAMVAAWDVATGAARTTPFRVASHPESARVRVVGESIYSAVDNQLRTWSLAPFAPFDNVAVAGAARVRNRRDIGENAYDVHAASGLLVTGGSDGTIGMWRLPPPALLRARAAPMLPRNQGYDGRRIVAVDGVSVQLLDVATQAPLSPAFVHPQPVRFAELSFDGRSLVTVAGRAVRVIDPATGALRGAPVVLPQSPLRAELARAAAVAVLTTGEYAGDAFKERFHVIDLDNGQLRTDAARYPGPLQEFNLDPLGRYALVSSFSPASAPFTFAVLDFAGPATRCEWLEEPDTGWITDTAIADDGRSAWYSVSMVERRGRMLRLELAHCAILANMDFKQVGYLVGIQPNGDGVVAHRLATDALTVLDADGRRRDVAGLTIGGSMRAFALSHDGRRAAQATRNAVLLVDLARGERLSAPLAAPIAGNDAIAKLAFSPDATQLLARTIRGRWLVWNLPIATQDVRVLAQLAALLDPDAADAERSAQAIEDLRRGLRAADPGVPALADAREWPRIVLPADAGAAVDPRFVPLDLAAAINVPLNGAWPRSAIPGGDLVTLAPGPQRLNGIDWRVDGGIQLSWGGGPPAEIHPALRASAMVPVPMVRARRAHVLLLSQIGLLQDAPPRRAAMLVLIGADGHETLLEIQTVRDVSMHRQREIAGPSARIGWVGPWVTALRLGFDGDPQSQSHVYAVSLDVPPDTGSVRGVRLEVGDGPMEAPLFYAVTLETAAPADDDAQVRAP